MKFNCKQFVASVRLQCADVFAKGAGQRPQAAGGEEG